MRTQSLIDLASEIYATGLDQGQAVHGILDFAKTIRVSDGGPEDGIYRPDLHPAQHAALQAIAADWRDVVLVGPRQDGKTLAGLVIPLLHCVIEERRPALLGGPRVEDCAAVYAAKVRPAILASHLEHHMPDEGGGARRGVPESILFRTGGRLFLRGAGGANEAQQSSITVRRVVLTEIDSIGLSGHTARHRRLAAGRRRIELFSGRRDAWGARGQMILESTIKDDRDSLILRAWSESTACELVHPCPACQVYSARRWEQVTYDAGDVQRAAATVRLACPCCGSLMTPDEASAAAHGAKVLARGQQIVDGQVCGDPIATMSWGIRWSALDSTLRDLRLLAQLHLTATRARDDRGDHDPMRQFYRDQLTLPYTEDESQASVAPAPAASALAARSAASAYSRGTVPFPGIVVVAIDQQERELYWLAMVLDGDRSGVIDWGEEYLCHRHETPSAAQRREALDRIAARAAAGWPLTGTDRMQSAALGCVDVGGRGWLDTTDAWLRAHRVWLAVRGDTRDCRVDELGKRDTDACAGWWAFFERAHDGRRLVLADADNLKGVLHRGLAASVDHSAAVLLPKGVAAGDWLVRHLLAEEQRYLAETGKVGWVKCYYRNDYLDCAVYALALARWGADRAKRRMPSGWTPPRRIG
jgi:phage terminase large subunit GpA-like protein